jgi:hypothetical protein
MYDENRTFPSIAMNALELGATISAKREDSEAREPGIFRRSGFSRDKPGTIS